ncbi:MAG: hypothetical protein ACREXJ_08325 [Gammaproteobacteria bacterium]
MILDLSGEVRMAEETITQQVSARYARALRAGVTVLDIGFPHFAVSDRAGEPVAGEAVACGVRGSCC